MRFHVGRQLLRLFLYTSLLLGILFLGNFLLVINGSVRNPQRSSRRQRILSYSLYGSDPRYTQGAHANAVLFEHIYKDWEMRVYHDESVPSAVLSDLEKLGVQLVQVDEHYTNKMTWRFLPAADPDIECFCSRDIDSRLSIREKSAVDEWLLSGKVFHVMRDHPSHSQFDMSGGMWCTKSKELLHIDSMLRQATLRDTYLDDMMFLNTYVWPIARNSVMQHDSFSCERYHVQPFPTPRIGDEHVGSVFVDGKMRSGDVDILRKAIDEGKECKYN